MVSETRVSEDWASQAHEPVSCPGASSRRARVHARRDQDAQTLSLVHPSFSQRSFLSPLPQTSTQDRQKCFFLPMKVQKEKQGSRALPPCPCSVLAWRGLMAALVNPCQRIKSSNTHPVWSETLWLTWRQKLQIWWRSHAHLGALGHHARVCQGTPFFTPVKAALTSS